MTSPEILAEFQSAPQLMEKLLAAGTRKSIPAGETILRENAYIQAIVIEGTVKVIRTDDDGREIVLYYIRPGESCIMSILSGIHQLEQVLFG